MATDAEKQECQEALQLDSGERPASSVSDAGSFVIDFGRKVSKQENLQEAFKKYKKKRQKEICHAKRRREVPNETRLRAMANPDRMWALRMKFVEQAKKYFGVPYARKYWTPDDPEYHSKLFMDCCGLTRRVLRDLQRQFRFRIGPWNQCYQYDTLPITVEREEDMKPGDLVFISATYYNPKTKKQKHDLTHVEIWLGDGPKTIGARWQKGHVQVFDSYRFTAKSYHSESYHFKSIDTWLMGICRSHCPQHKWKLKKKKSKSKSEKSVRKKSHCPEHEWKTHAEVFEPGKKSVFALQPEEEEDDQGAGDTDDELVVENLGQEHSLAPNTDGGGERIARNPDIYGMEDVTTLDILESGYECVDDVSLVVLDSDDDEQNSNIESESSDCDQVNEPDRELHLPTSLPSLVSGPSDQEHLSAETDTDFQMGEEHSRVSCQLPKVDGNIGLIKEKLENVAITLDGSERSSSGDENNLNSQPMPNLIQLCMPSQDQKELSKESSALALKLKMEASNEELLLCSCPVDGDERTSSQCQGASSGACAGAISARFTPGSKGGQAGQAKDDDGPNKGRPPPHAPIGTPRPWTSAPRLRKTYFIGGGNGAALIESILNERGWRRIADKHDDTWTLKWVECKATINYEIFREGEQLVNHLPNCQLLTNKLGLLSSLQAYERVNSGIHGKEPQLRLSDFLPETYRLDDPREREEFFHTYKDGEVWICKPTGLNQGKGIYLVRNAEEMQHQLAERRERKARKPAFRLTMDRIISRYIVNPLLLEGKKFDIRSYLLIASTVPYLVLFHHGYVRCSMLDYDKDSTVLTAHLTNQYIQKRDPNYNDVKEETAWSMDRLNDYINQKVAPGTYLEIDWVYKTLTYRMRQIMLHCFRAVQHRLERRQGYFELYGLDFMIDTQFKVWLIEVNVNPSLSTNCQALEDRVIPLMRETLDICIECFEKCRVGRNLLPLQAQHSYHILYHRKPFIGSSTNQPQVNRVQSPGRRKCASPQQQFRTTSPVKGFPGRKNSNDASVQLQDKAEISKMTMNRTNAGTKNWINPAVAPVQLGSLCTPLEDQNASSSSMGHTGKAFLKMTQTTKLVTPEPFGTFKKQSEKRVKDLPCQDKNSNSSEIRKSVETQHKNTNLPTTEKLIKRQERGN